LARYITVLMEAVGIRVRQQYFYVHHYDKVVERKGYKKHGKPGSLLIPPSYGTIAAKERHESISR